MARNDCLDCVKNDEDCCSSFYSRFLTIGDAKRISRRTGKRPSSFIRFAELSENDRKTELFLKRPHGYYYDLALGGKLLQLKALKDGSCLFFSKGSCSIYASRPLICRVFPFWYHKNGRIIVDNNGVDCPLVCGKEPPNSNPSASRIKEGLKRMGCRKDEMERLLYQFRKEMEEYRRGIIPFVQKNGL